MGADTDIQLNFGGLLSLDVHLSSEGGTENFGQTYD